MAKVSTCEACIDYKAYVCVSVITILCHRFSIPHSQLGTVSAVLLLKRAIVGVQNVLAYYI